MKFTTTQQDFSKAIAIASKALAKRPIHPVLEYFLIESDGAIVSSNLQTFITQKFEVQEEIQGSVLVKAKMLMDLIKKLPKGELSLELTEDNVSVSSKGNYYKLETWKEVDDFPEIPNFDLGFESKITVPTKDFLEGVQRTAYAASTNEYDHELTGICITNSEDFLEFAATDKCRLVVANFDKIESCKFKAVIPATVLIEVEKILRKTKNQSMELTINSGMCQIVCGDFNIKTRLLEGDYPKVIYLIPTNFKRMATCDRALLLESLVRLSAYADNPRNKMSPDNLIELKISADKSFVSVLFNKKENSVEENIAFSLVGEAIQITFNIFYLIDALKFLPRKDVTFNLNDEKHQTIIVSDVAKVKALLMPIQKRK